MKYLFLLTICIAFVNSQQAFNALIGDELQEIDPPDNDVFIPHTENNHESANKTTNLLIFGMNLTLHGTIDNTYMQPLYCGDIACGLADNYECVTSDDEPQYRCELRTLRTTGNGDDGGNGSTATMIGVGCVAVGVLVVILILKGGSKTEVNIGMEPRRHFCFRCCCFNCC